MLNASRKLRSLSRIALLLAIATSAVAQEQHLRELLTQASHASRPQPWARLMMQADREATTLEREKFTRDDIRTLNVLPFGDLHYRWNGIANVEEYQHDILRRVVRELKGTPTGATALADILGDGAYGSWLDTDELSPARFSDHQIHRKVISIVDAPAWRKRNDVRLIRIEAEAYETWWCLSRLDANFPLLYDVGATPEEYKDGAEAARLQSIRLYERVLAAGNVPGLLERVTKLRNREDTHEWKWFRGGD